MRSVNLETLFRSFEVKMKCTLEERMIEKYKWSLKLRVFYKLILFDMMKFTYCSEHFICIGIDY